MSNITYLPTYQSYLQTTCIHAWTTGVWGLSPSPLNLGQKRPKIPKLSEKMCQIRGESKNPNILVFFSSAPSTCFETFETPLMCLPVYGLRGEN